MFNADNTTIDGFDFRCTSVAFPEQYDVFKDGVQVAYLRLRHGWFRVNYPNYDGDVIYTANPEGDGSFEDRERDRYLREALDAIKAHMSIHSS